MTCSVHPRFLDHSFSDYTMFTDPDADGRKIDPATGIAILASYVMNYGPFAAERVQYWPLADRLVGSLGGGSGPVQCAVQPRSSLLPVSELA
jgi:hypothetical protein